MTIEELMEGCGNHGCIIKKPEGQATNGRCRCVSTTTIHLLMAEVERLEDEAAIISGTEYQKGLHAGRKQAAERCAEIAEKVECNQRCQDELASEAIRREFSYNGGK